MALDPTTIGRYRVLRVLGRGAMGLVYLGEDPRLKRKVAIKVLHDTLDDRATYLLRFQREAAISARLHHPNIVSVFDVGEESEAGPYMAMEYVEGMLLSRFLRQESDPETLARLLIQAAWAIQASSEAGIVHRDIKPDNMIVGKDGRLKLMDFGVALGDEPRLTRWGTLFGTPAYYAPEMLVGGEPSLATDRYAFAVTAFEVLTGTLPFAANHMGTLLYSVVHDRPQIPQGHGAAFEAVFQKALAKAPEDRYPDLFTFLEELLRSLPLAPESTTRLLATLTGEVPLTWHRPFPTLLATPVVESPKGPPPPWFQQHPWILVTAGILAMAGLAALFWPPSQRRVDISSSPAEADVMVNGRFLGRTPLQGLRLAEENTLLRVERPGFQPVIRELGPNEWNVHLILPRMPYLVSVVSDPAGAEVYLDGRAMGLTPMTGLAVPIEGRHEILLMKAGCLPWKQVLDAEAPLPALIRLRRIGDSGKPSR